MPACKHQWILAAKMECIQMFLERMEHFLPVQLLCRYNESPLHNTPIEVIMLEILTRVLTKDVSRSKSVCKERRALLSTSDFERLHCSRSLQPELHLANAVTNLAKQMYPLQRAGISTSSHINIELRR